MSAARTAEQSAPDAVAAALADAPFVRVVARADGDALAAAGLLARALRERDVPFQVHVDPDPAPEPAADAVLVTTGVSAPAADYALASDAAPASVSAAAVSRHLAVDPDPVLGLAGAVAAGTVPGADGTDQLLADAQERGLLERRPGVAVPTADLADGLAHSTLLSAPFSGDREAARDALTRLGLPVDADGVSSAPLDEDAHRRVASLVAVEVVGIEDADPGAADAVERAVHPYATPESPFATLGGYADVLAAVARERPGTGVALALGHRSARETALDAWRVHADAVHAGLRSATTGRYDGLLAARLDGELDAGRLATAARLLSAFRSPEPVTLAIAGTTAAAVSDTDRQLGQAMATTVATLAESDAGSDSPPDAESAPQTGPRGYGTGRRGEAQFDADASTFIAAFREAL